ncbi:somatostatin receptor type 2-like [Microplitis mediator]|uniref:somatostatin receptor type 2 n=1 Tax=Microplitis demolitor TaxID=69319 RepID=UPI0004CCF75D|nr:somatostatin receptor type 2 [Microplitis demolitor]XP_053599141.1 somatostatin receptor type 2 [Microplitis demolitor]XP_057321606.1 somatostatin receptor type 2-like [Microplitis mediator]XP_057321607.1 somatostatin receptor type 2-like [Microplitis mediator]XP_057321608.1 somatostatin receptor type 2-like [Microplitis mediator]XP_057321609.1 somatostatin receptor type 2-like [Microplitis mediator]
MNSTEFFQETLNTTNDTLNFNCGTDLRIVAIVHQVIYSIVCVVGLLGNTLVIYVVLRFSKMQTVTNMYIVNLAIADECFLIGIPFLVTTLSLRYWPFGEIMCKAYMTTTSINQFTSSIFLFIMSADRYIAVCHPISATKMRTPFISKVVSMTAWFTSALFMIPVVLYANVNEFDNGISCNIYWPDNNIDNNKTHGNQTALDEHQMHGGQTTFTLYTFFLTFAVPLTFILVFYFLVIRKLQTVGPKNKSKEKKRSHKKVTKLVLTVITVYVLCWLPYWITQVALIYEPPKQCQSSISITAFLLAGFLSYSNSAMNPILYAFLSDNFKKSFLKACTCAAGKDINATLHNENSVFPKKNKSDHDKLKSSKAIASANSRAKLEDEEDERGLLISKTSTTTVTMTSRTNITVISDSKDQKGSKGTTGQRDKDCLRNGAQLTLLTQV